MKALLCVAVLALVASTIAYPHQAAINNLHNLDNNVRKLLQMLVTNIQEETVSVEKQEQEEEEVVPTNITDKLIESIDEKILQLLSGMKAQSLEAEEKAMAQSDIVEYESFDSNNDQLSETVNNIDVKEVLQRQGDERAMAQRWGRK